MHHISFNNKYFKPTWKTTNEYIFMYSDALMLHLHLSSQRDPNGPLAVS